MSHLPWINHLAAQEAGVSLKEFNELEPEIQQSWKDFVIRGPSRLRHLLMMTRLTNMCEAYMTGKATTSAQNREYLDGLISDPDEVAKEREKERREKALEADLAETIRLLNLDKDDGNWQSE